MGEVKFRCFITVENMRKILDLLKDTDRMFIINQRVVTILGPNSTVPIAEIDVYQEKLREDI